MTTTAPPTGQADDLADVAAIGRALNESVIFCHVSVSRWRGHKSVQEAVVKVEGKDADAQLITTPRWKLLDDSWTTRFSHVENSLRDVISTASPSFAIPGVYVIPRLRARALFERVDAIASEQFWPLVDELAAGWPDYLKALKERATPEQWEQIEKALPYSAQALRGHFRVTKHVIPLTGGGGSMADLSLMADAAKKLIRGVTQDLVRDAADEEALDDLVQKFWATVTPLLKRKELAGGAADAFAQEITEATRKFVMETALEITNSLQEELLAAVDKLSQRIDAQGVVQERTIKVVEAAFEKFRSFAFVATPTVLAKMREVEHRLNEVTFQDINEDNRHGDRAVSTGISAALKALREEADRELSGGAGGLGRRLRQIQL